MKVAQNDETNPNTQPVRPPRIPNLSNSQLPPPSGTFAQKRETPGILSRMFLPFAGITYYRVRAHLTLLVVLSCIDMHMFTWYSLFLPPLLLLDIETDAALTQYDYGVDDPSLLPEQPGKPPPLITRYRLFFSILLALE